MKEKMERWRFNNRNTKGKRICFHQNPPKAAQDASKNRQRKALLRRALLPIRSYIIRCPFFLCLLSTASVCFRFPTFPFFFTLRVWLATISGENLRRRLGFLCSGFLVFSSYLKRESPVHHVQCFPLNLETEIILTHKKEKKRKFVFLLVPSWRRQQSRDFTLRDKEKEERRKRISAMHDTFLWYTGRGVCIWEW